MQTFRVSGASFGIACGQYGIKSGDRITVTGGRAKNGSFNLRGVYVELRDGRRLLGLPGPEP